ncbi:MAG: DUF11 domain-containing protein [Planctomycetia bacterium]|nr:DUF11 domain-containing protein [Planctomycetia bacterium]
MFRFSGDFATGPATRKNTTSDPFASGDGGDDEPKDRPARPVSRKSAAESRPAISIVDLDDEDPLSGIDDSPAAKRKTASTSRGSVLSLDDDAEDDLNKPARKATSRPKSSSGPRLLGATDDEAEKPMSSELDADDLPTDDDSAPARKPRRDPVTLDDDLDLSDEKETPAPPRKLADDAKLGQPGRKLPGADLKDDDDLTIDTTPSRRSDLDDEIPIRTKPKSLDLEDDPAEPDLDLSRKATDEVNRPAELGRTIEIDESIPNTPSPRKAALPQITIEKHAPATAVLGRPMVYTILVKNIGPTPAHQVVVEDVIPVEFQIDGSIPQALLKDDKLIWKLGTLPAGQAKKISVRVVPQSEGTTGGVATVTFSGEPVRPQASAPRLKFDVSAPRQAAIGTPVEFNFHVRNVGTVPANGVTIRDVLPAGLKHPDGDDLEYNLGELPAGKSQDVKLTLTAAQAGPTINRVVVTADGDVAEEAQVQLDVVGPTLLVSRSGPKKMIPGKTASFSSTVTNPGTGAVTGVSVVEKIPPGMEFVDAGEGGVYDQAKRIVFWSIRQLAAGEARTVTLSLRSVSRGAQISVIRAYDSSGSTGEATGATKVAGVPALTIEVGEIPALIEAGEIVKVPVRILNRGSDTATAVKAKITVPPELQILSADGPTSYREKSTAKYGNVPEYRLWKSNPPSPDIREASAKELKAV